MSPPGTLYGKGNGSELSDRAGDGVRDAGRDGDAFELEPRLGTASPVDPCKDVLLDLDRDLEDRRLCGAVC